MSQNPFYRLAPFVQEFIYKHNWAELREVQVEACQVIFDTDAHLLLATGTASGKTEAAFLPVITLLHEDPPATVGALYIGPLKALINDQFVRLTELLEEADIPAWHWHGDVSQAHKRNLIKDPRGILQITPESLESMLLNKATELPMLFGDLRFIVIDEVHVFMGSDRGRQVLCQLTRLAKFMRTAPRRIGLSATLGDYHLAEEWLRSGTDRAVVTPQVGGGRRTVRIAVEHFIRPPEADEDTTSDRSVRSSSEGSTGTGVPAPLRQEDSTEDSDGIDPYYRYVYNESRGRKCLIFANSRAEAESVIAELRLIAQTRGEPDIYHVHHGSIAAPLREAAEEAMRDPHTPAVTAATVTLELGIDIGQLERVLQLGAPYSVSSFLQRLGRSGRRGNPPEMWLISSERAPSGKESLPELVPWDLLQIVAEIQLFIEERWIEPIPPVRYPMSLLYHQTMSTLAASGELSPAALAQRVLTLPPFAHVSKDDYATLLRHLIAIDHIQESEERGLIVGLAGERVVRNYRFYAVFADSDEYTVLSEGEEIGSIPMPPPLGECFGLAGRTWEVVELDDDRRVIQARPVRGHVKSGWHGGIGETHSRILQRMRQALFEDTRYPYLRKGAMARLEDARKLVRSACLDRRNVVSLGGNRVCVFPWMGTVAFRTLVRCLSIRGKALGAQLDANYEPYYLVMKSSRDVDEVSRRVASLAGASITAEALVSPDEAPRLQKYDEFIPDALLLKAFASDCLDVEAMRAALVEWQGA